MNRYLFILCLFTLSLSSNAQSPPLENFIPALSKFAPENVYLHWDKTFCMSGDTLWFKGYVLQGSYLSANSTSLMVEMFDERGYLMVMKSFPVVSGIAIGQIEVPDNCSPGLYYLRAYTKWQLNFDYKSLYHVPVTIIDTKSDKVPVLSKVKRNQESNIVYKDNISMASMQTPKGLEITIRSDSSTYIDSVLDLHILSSKISGNRRFILRKNIAETTLFPLTKLQAGHEVDIILTDKNNHVIIQSKTYLPASLLDVDIVTDTISNQQKGLNAWKIAIKDTAFVTLSVSVTDAGIDTGRVTINNSISSTSFDYQSILNNKFPSLNFVDSTYISLRGKAQRINSRRKLGKKNLFAFITSKDSSQTFQIIPLDTAGRFNLSNLFFYDTCTVSFQLEDKERRAKDVELRFDRFFRPPFIPDTSSFDFITRTALQQSPLLSVSKRRENHFSYDTIGTLKEVIVEEKMKTTVEKMDEEYTTGAFRGGINSKGFDLINHPGPVGMNVLGYLESKFPLQVVRNKKGQISGVRHRQDLLLFFLNEMQVDLQRIIELPLTAIAYVKIHPSPFAGGSLMQGAISVYTRRGRKLEIPEPGLLKEVVVSAKRSYKELDSAYTTDIFSRKADHSIDLRLAKKEHDLFRFLQETIIGFSVVDIPGLDGPRVTFRGKPVLFFIDEYPMALWQVKMYRYSVNFLAYAKLFGSFFYNGEITQGLALYTRQGADVEGQYDGLNKAKLAGYDRILMPYQADYSDSAGIDYADTRINLYWAPLLKERESVIRFYNNDFTKKFKITIEGIGREGELLHFEKIIQP